ncbi:hypothetical protein BUALT_Bualt15G0027900 [Buddleja alternifolia]|uniref:Cytochrome P450 n=1 Tax=Buddleja alternifolia TaxID=168488 RepID=A0AAV6WCR9_9LAMI|nr:hypothetical protein BUALT_Bualt15G0027900 [Buddleja alternifolia]
MLSYEIYVVAFITIFLSRWIYRWRNPKCKGILPPGSSGLPLIGESLQLLIQRYTRNLTLSHFGVECIKQKLLSQFEQLVHKTFQSWSMKESVEVEYASIAMFGEFGANLLYSYDPESLKEFTDKFTNVSRAAMSFPLNIPGTTYHKCLKAEHEEILKKRENVDSSVTWEEYKSMKFTLQASYTIPKGWGIMVCPSIMHLDPNTYKDPLTFNPWRWKVLQFL